MKAFSVIFLYILQIHFDVTTSQPYSLGGARCINLWDEGCIGGQLQGAGRDDDFVNGGFNPGKRCVDEHGAGCGRAGENNEYFHDDFLRTPLRYNLLAKLYKNAQN